MANSETLRFEYGKTQVLTSPRMRKRPGLSRLIFRIFGYTSVGNWARAHIFINRLGLLPVRNFKKILDLGAGLGEFTFMIAEALPDSQLTALEILPYRIADLKTVVASQHIKNVTIFEDKIEALPETAAYDFIFSVDVFEHILKEEMPFDECYKKLKPGGYMLVKIPNITQLTICPDAWFQEHNEWLEDEHVGQVYNLDGLRQRFKDAGFKIIHASYSDGWISRVAWELSYFTAKGGAIVQLLFLPVCKFIYYIEWLTFSSKKKGNAIQVIGQR
jgi:2-polyprenyl-3-methyl-5-hydroxy-6-metoxy-1,4-benzoquinol methylase